MSSKAKKIEAEHPRMLRGDLSGFDSAKPKGIGVLVFNDERPLQGAAGFLDWRLCGALSSVIEKGFFQGEYEESMMLPKSLRWGQATVFVYGLGKKKNCSKDRLSDAAEGLFTIMKSAGALPAMVTAPDVHDDSRIQQDFIALAKADDFPFSGVFSDVSAAKK